MFLEPPFDVLEAGGGHREGHMLHAADGIAVGRRFGALGNLEERQQAVVAHVEEIMAQIFVGRVAPVLGAGAKPRRHPHGMHQRHAQHIDIKFRRHLHVFGGQ